MYKPSKRIVLFVLAAGLLVGVFGVWVLLHPASIFVQPWRAERAAAPVDGVLLGPYPVEEDFVELKRRGVTTIISLLEPNVPYEKVLLEQERKLARQYGMTVQNFPMGSILGQKFGDAYAVNSEAAAEAALNADGIAYIHCYLGLHRARNVQGYLEAHVRTAQYGGSIASANASDLDNEHVAQTAFDAGDYPRSLQALARIPSKGLRAARLEGWNHYRLQQMAQARSAFQGVLRRFPDDTDAMVGLGYVELSDKHPDQADTLFSRAVEADPDDVSAIEGMGHVRYRQGRFGDARIQFARALELNPGDPETREMLARIERFDPNGASAQAEAP
ncbi:tetratricopeptide repeat protein [Thermomonas sp. HDW16]|uniref:tetratricopeptide repeat protein n=1 Tax=Thermomonas sp. HDW16 TaxID=2714945 RepID=UPI001407EC78|nr:tetratricopeptide repeat protein [Thermomonas sp. HDW16]QIL19597.1 tetratricopeptide repeat protein [Thermomonas sp. HDW16]